MYVVIEKNAHDKSVVVMGWHGERTKANNQADLENERIKNLSEWVVVVTSTVFKSKYARNAIAQ